MEMTFTLFPTLPPDLRIKIWKYALPGRRVIEIKYHEDDSLPPGSPSSPDSRRATSCSAKSTVPNLLQVCHESRSLALKSYESSFESQLRYPVYFDPTQDTLRMVSINALDAFFQVPGTKFLVPEKIPVYFLALSVSSALEVGYSVTGVCKAVEAFVGLLKVTIVRNESWVDTDILLAATVSVIFKAFDDSRRQNVVSPAWEKVQLCSMADEEFTAEFP